MKRKIISFILALVFILSLTAGFAFASSECEHQFTDDGDCTTPAVCSLCGESKAQSEHNFNTVLFYTLTDDSNILLGGTKSVKCSNDGCGVKETIKIDSFVKQLGYSVKNNNNSDPKREKSTLITTFIIEASELDSYANANNKKIEYGVICYIPTKIGKAAPIKANGNAGKNVAKVQLNGKDGVNDLAVPQIPASSYDRAIVFAFYLIMDETVYYIQSNKSVTDHNQLTAVSCNDVYSKLNG